MANSVFSDWPITKKLMWIMHGATLLAVLFASLLFGASETFSFRKATLNQIATLSGVIGTNSTAAITFEDPELAGQVLGSLSANQAVISATVFLTHGELFSTYHAETDAETQVPAAARELVEAAIANNSSQQRFNGLKFVDAVHPITFDDEAIGYLHLRTSLNSFVTTLQRIAAVAVIVMLLAVVVAYVLSSRLQSAVSFPIQNLSGLMKRVTNDQDYSLRAEPKSGDEIGALMVGFNDMLKQINLRDEKLAFANQELSDAFDETLSAKEAAELASSAKSDFLARFGGEEFVVLMPETNLDSAVVAADKLLKAVEECEFHYQNSQVSITISAGLAQLREDDSTESLFQRADQAMYRAKQAGRNQYLVEASS